MCLITNKRVIGAVSSLSYYPLLWWSVVFICLRCCCVGVLHLCRQVHVVSETQKTNCNSSQRLCRLFLSVKGEGVGLSLVRLFGVCNHIVNSRGNLDSSLCFHFPGLVLPHTTYSFMRNIHVCPKAPHPEPDAQLPPGLGVALGACIEHPGGSRGMWGGCSEHGHVASSSPCPQHRSSL